MAKKQEPRKLSLEDGAKYLLNHFGNRLAPPLEGLAYRFTIWLPVQAKASRSLPGNTARSYTIS
jgi:hypothetical protein